MRTSSLVENQVRGRNTRIARSSTAGGVGERAFAKYCVEVSRGVRSEDLGQIAE